MAEVRDLLVALVLKDVRLGVKHGELVIDDPRGALNEQELASIRIHRAALTALLESAQSAVSVAALTPKSRSERLPLSYAQERLWFDQKFDRLGRNVRIAAAFMLCGTLEKQALRRALNTLVERHEVLRTTFCVVSGEPLQRISPHAFFELREIDLRTEPEEEREATMRGMMLEESVTAFDLDNGPVIRGRLIRLRDGAHVLLVTVHHIAADGCSLDVISQEVGALYVAYREGRLDPLPPLPIQCADYALWEREWYWAGITGTGRVLARTARRRHRLSRVLDRPVPTRRTNAPGRHAPIPALAEFVGRAG